MGFEDLLNRRLGPMKDLLTLGPRPLPPDYALENLFFRRALGLEFFYEPETSPKTVRVEIPNRNTEKLKLVDAVQLVQLVCWTKPGDQNAISSKQLWKWAQLGLLNFSQSLPPTVAMSLELANDEEGVRLRQGCWINLALEDPVQIHPIPFMPRRSDLEHTKIVGVRFSSRARDVDILGLTITGSENLGTKIQQLVPRLNGHSTRLELEKILDTLSFQTLEVLQSFGFLQGQSLETVSGLADPTEAQVTWLGHASVLYQSEGVNILVDPLFFSQSVPASRRYRDRPFDPLSLPPIDAVLITHGDNDHLNPNSLAFLDRETKIIVPRLEEPPAPYHVDIRGLLNRMGFKNIIEMSAWSNLSIGPVTITACPFEGENWGLKLPQLTYLMYSESLAIYCSADSYVMPETFQRLQETRPKIDIAFMGVTGCSEPYAVDARFGYGNFYRDWIPEIQHHEWIQHCMGPTEVCEMLALFEPSYVFGYAAGGADFIEISFSDRGTHEELAALITNADLKTQARQCKIGQAIAASALK